MHEQVVFGLSANQVMAWSSVISSALVVVLIAINFYYARHAKRQADASIKQAEASNRQADMVPPFSAAKACTKVNPLGADE